jgi:hypothetical protein
MVGRIGGASPAKDGDGLIVTVSDLEIFRARTCISIGMATRRLQKARDIVRNLKERGDNEAPDTWLRIIVVIEVLQRGSAT